jgi:hypothetical protein
MGIEWSKIAERPFGPTFKTSLGSDTSQPPRKAAKIAKGSITTHLKVRVTLFRRKTNEEMPAHQSPIIATKIKKAQSQCVRVTLLGGVSPH